MKKIFIPILFLLGCTKEPVETPVIITPKAFTETTYIPPRRIALSHDGDKHDRDDILSVSMELGMIAKAGLQANLVAFIYNDHWWQTDVAQQRDETNSVLNTAKAWGGYDMTKFISAQNNHTAAVNLLVAEINKSTVSDTLVIGGLGPMQVIGEALAKSNTTARKYVKVISHSVWNNEHAGRYGAGEGLPFPRYNLESGYSSTPISGMGVKIVKIKDQNATVSAPYSSYDWLQYKYSNDNKLDLIWQEGAIAGKSNFDCSDAGVVWFILKNDQDGSPSKIRTFFGGTQTLMALTTTTATIKLMLFNGTIPLDTTILYLNDKYNTSYSSAEGDKIAASSNNNQVGAIVNSYLLSRDYIPYVCTAPIRLYRLTHPSYTLRIVSTGFPSTTKATFRDNGDSTSIPLNTTKEFPVNFTDSIPSYSDRIKITFTK